MMNAVGLQNIGVQAFVAEKLPKLRQMAGAVVIANVFGFEIEDYVAVIRALNDAEGVAMYELNASCPIRRTGDGVWQRPSLLYDLVKRCRATADRAGRPLMVKLSPNVTSIARMARVAQEAGRRRSRW